MGDLQHLPIRIEETPGILRKLAAAHRYLAELKGVSSILPDPAIIIESLALREAKESSEIENIISTFDDIYSSESMLKRFASPQAKEVNNYAEALKSGYELVRENHLLTINFILQVHATIEENSAGFRKLPGTVLKNEQSGKVVFTPPQDPQEILDYMYNLESFINNEKMSGLDTLVKMAIIHHRFETIHPFYDGNGRTGRILNILYLIKSDLLELPVLYMSRYIIRTKNEYYSLLQEVRDKGYWENWILYMLQGIVESSQDSTRLIRAISASLETTASLIKKMAPKIYSLELVRNLFHHPYTKIEYLMSDLSISRNTSVRYLEQLVTTGILSKKKIGRDNYFLNNDLVGILKAN